MFRKEAHNIQCGGSLFWKQSANLSVPNFFAYVNIIELIKPIIIKHIFTLNILDTSD